MIYKSEIDINEIINGSRDYDKVWVCDFRQTDLNKKPIRKILPTYVEVRPITDARNKRIYYTESCFFKLNKKGEWLKTPIPVFDNTGYRSYKGVSLRAFTEEGDCRGCFKAMCLDIKNNIESWLEGCEDRAKTLEKEIDELCV